MASHPQDVSFRGKSLYTVEFRQMNTERHGGIPQHRERIYIAGIQKGLLPHDADKDNFRFTWPHTIPAPTLTKFLSPNTQPKWIPASQGYLAKLVGLIEKIVQDGGNPKKINYCVDISASENFNKNKNYMEERCPTLTRARAAVGGYYMTAWQRLMTTREVVKLQGFPSDAKRCNATERQFRQMLGNAMTVTVVARVMEMLLKAGGYMPAD